MRDPWSRWRREPGFDERTILLVTGRLAIGAARVTRAMLLRVDACAQIGRTEATS